MVRIPFQQIQNDNGLNSEGSPLGRSLERDDF